jgi:AcrR family transcriptional regulator
MNVESLLTRYSVSIINSFVSAALSKTGEGAPNRFDRRREKTREDLIEAAERVISSKGLHQARIADIAAEADVGLGTFYLHFKTKNEIFMELVEQGASHMREEIAEAKAAATDPADKLRIAIENILNDAAEEPELFRIVFGHTPAFLNLMERVFDLFIDDFRADLTPVAGDDADTIAHLIVGMLSQAISWMLDNPELPREHLKETIVNFALGGLQRIAARVGGSDGKRTD